MKNFFIVFLLLVSGYSSKAQYEAGSWDLGINTGFYLPSNYHAKFYNGSAGNVNNLDFIFGNKYRYDEIRNLINASDTFYVNGIPQNMKYTPAFAIGIYIKRSINKESSITINFNYSKLTIADKFTVLVDPLSIATEDDIRIYDIWGKEVRTNIDLVYTKTFLNEDNVFPFLEFGLNVNSIDVNEHKIGIENQEFSIVNRYLNNSYVPGAQINEYDVKQGGLGYGFLVGGGLKLYNPGGISIEPGANIYFKQISLENYKAFRPAFVVFVRFSLGDYFGSDA